MPNVKKNITIMIAATIVIDDNIHIADLTTEKLILSHGATVMELTTVDIAEDSDNQFDSFLESADMPQD